MTTFSSLPDAPISRFTMTIKGGKRGIIASTRNLCKAPKSQLRGIVRLRGHHDKSRKTQKPRISTACKKPKKTSSKKRTTKKSSSAKKSSAAKKAAGEATEARS